MPRAVPILPALNGGEWSPVMYGRVDLGKYGLSCRKLRNFVLLAQGGAHRREGTRYVMNTRGDAAAWLIPFEFSTVQAYMIVATESVFRFCKDRAMITEAAQAITGATQANPCVITIAGHGYSNGDEVFIAGVGGMTQLNSRQFVVANVTANTFELSGVNSTGYGVYTSGGTAARLYQIASPYTAALLPAVKWAQSADVMYLVHPSVRPKKLTRTGHTSWSIANYPLVDGPYLPQNTSATTLALSATTGSVTVTASAAVFAATDVGRLIRWAETGQWTWLEITAYTSSTQVTATIKGQAAPTGAASIAWRLGAWSDTTGWPAAVSFFQERLWFGRTATQPQTAWSTKSGDYENFEPSTVGPSPAPAPLDDNAITLTISDNKVNAILWMSAGKQMVIGTVGGEFTLAASSLNEAITPNNATVRPETSRGVADTMPVRVGQAVLFVQRARRKLFEMAYSYEVDAQVAPDMTLLASHIGRSRLKQIVYQAEPWSMLWVVRDDGRLVAFTYQRDQQVTGWAQHPIAGTPSSGVGGRVLSAGVISGDGQDELWLVVERTVNGTARRFVEYLSYEFWPENSTDLDYANFLDAGLQLDNTVAQSLALSFGPGPTDVTCTAGGAAFVAGDVGREIRIRYLHTPAALDGEEAEPVYKWGRIRIDSYSSSTVVFGTVITPLPSSPIASGAWHMTVTTVGGLWHLEGEVVQLLVDGGPHENAVVTSGTVALTRAAAVAQIGLGYASRLETLDIEAGAADGTSQSRRRRADTIALRLWATLGARVGRAGSMETVQFRRTTDPMDAPPPLYSGDKLVPFPAGWKDEMRVIVEQTQPLPCTVTAIMPRITAGE